MYYRNTENVFLLSPFSVHPFFDFLKIMSKRIVYTFILFVFVLNSCKDTDTTPQNKNLVSGTLVKEYTKEQFITELGSFGSSVSLFVRSGIKTYRIVYKTKNTDGTEVQASGGIVVPTGISEPLALASLQHGTILNDNEAPSYFNFNSEAAIGAFLAATGYIVAMPDYIGYGESKNLPHTYEHREGLATASLDFIRAAKEFIRQNNLNWNEKLYISGYSEGGFATMSLLKKIEEETGSEFNLKAATCGSGAYNKTQSFKNLLNATTGAVASNNRLYLWVLLTYDRIYKINRPMNQYFKEPYATQIQSQQQNVTISATIGTIVQDSFKTNFLNGTDTAFGNAVKDNDVFDWKPKSPLRLYHGDADPLVAYINSKTAFDAMRARGATNVELVTLPGRDHGTAVQDYLLGTFDFFSLNK
jgi:pimeloyl-ACP methyl ester carboxylesterase